MAIRCRPEHAAKQKDGKLLDGVPSSVTQLASKVQGVSMRSWKDVSSLFSRQGDHERLTECAAHEIGCKEEAVTNEQHDGDQGDMWGLFLKRHVTSEKNEGLPSTQACDGVTSMSITSESVTQSPCNREQRETSGSNLRAWKASLFRFGGHERLTETDSVSHDRPIGETPAEEEEVKEKQDDLWSFFTKRNTSTTSGRTMSSPFSGWSLGRGQQDRFVARETVSGETTNNTDLHDKKALACEGETQ
uniref:ADP-ribosylation factor GTPase-activating protein 1-like isoform X2 n=1 Tax=Myxine glutinosa TaxID=7769 RepID=UPI00358F796B